MSTNTDLFADRFAIGFPELLSIAAKDEARLVPVNLRARALEERRRLPRVVSEDGKQERLRIARQVYDEGGSISEFARRVHIHTSWASNWLRSADRELHRLFLDQPHPVALNRSARVARLLSVKIARQMGWTDKETAAALNICVSALGNWLRVWAPDGLDDALELELGDLEDAA